MSKRLKIGIDARYVQQHFPGIGRYVYGLVKGLAELESPETNFEIGLIYNPALPDCRHHLPELVQRYPTRLKLIETHVKPFSVGEQWRLFGLVRREKFDLWHAPYYIRPYVLPCASVLTVHDVIGARMPDALPSRKARWLFEITTQLALLSSPHIITVSNAARQDLLQLYKVRPARIRVVPEAADEQFQPFSPEEKELTRARLKLPSSYLLYLGINKPHKNLARLLEAFKLFRDKTDSKIVLVLAGKEDNRYAPALHQKAAQLGLTEESLRFWGEVSEADLPALYACADAFVFPSLYEGFGLPVLEAMQSGTPVICANNSSLPEVAGEAALLFRAEDVTELATRLEQLIENPALQTELSQKGLARAAQFSWQHTAEQTLRIYREAAG